MDYYHVAKKASSEIGKHAGLLYLQQLCQNANKVLDVGCGEGTRLATLLPLRQAGWGIDPNPKAIQKAKKQYPRFDFAVGEGEALPYRQGFFDLVYTAFAIEHCREPEEFIREMIRVCRPGGRLVFLAPNYGAPNRRSPVSTENPYNKFFEGLIKDIFPPPNLDWCRVAPREEYTGIDTDTTREPYLRSLLLYLRKCQLRIEIYSSLWSLEPGTGNPRQRLTEILGKYGIFPFKYWGPQLFVTAVKPGR